MTGIHTHHEDYGGYARNTRGVFSRALNSALVPTRPGVQILRRWADRAARLQPVFRCHDKAELRRRSGVALD